MSRTVKGSKAPGYEYWSRRIGGCLPPSKYSKKRTHKAERERGKQQLKQERDML